MPAFPRILPETDEPQSREYTNEQRALDWVQHHPGEPSAYDGFIAGARSAVMTEDEILRRARRALVDTLKDDTRGNESLIRKVTNGGSDDSPGVKSIVRALRDLDKPLEPTVSQRLADIARDWSFTGKSLVDALQKAYDMGKSDAD